MFLLLPGICETREYRIWQCAVYRLAAYAFRSGGESAGARGRCNGRSGVQPTVSDVGEVPWLVEEHMAHDAPEPAREPTKHREKI